MRPVDDRPPFGEPGLLCGLCIWQVRYRVGEIHPASTTVLTNVRFVDRSMDTFRSEPARLRRVPISTWRWNLLRDAAYAGAPRGRKPLGKAGISRGSRWAGVFLRRQALSHEKGVSR